MSQQRGTAMSSKRILVRVLMLGAAVCIYAAAGMAIAAYGAEPPKPVAGKQVHFPDGTFQDGTFQDGTFPNGTWSALPQLGPNGKVRQCVMVAPRPRAGEHGAIDTALSVDISAGAGLAFGLDDDKLPSEAILDDEAEVLLDGKSFPAVAFTVAEGNKLAFHPGDAAAVFAALAKTGTVQLRTDGGGLDTGPIKLGLPGDAYAWLKQCGTQFKIALDRPTDPQAPPLPVPRPHSPEVASAVPTPAGPPGIEDKQKIAGWDASELRGDDGRVLACMIRQHYAAGGANAHRIGIFLIVSRSRGLTILLKDSFLDLPGGASVDGTLVIDDKPFANFAAQVGGRDEIMIFPGHGAALAAALGDGATAKFDAVKVETLEFPVVPGVMPWLRACSRRWGISFETADAKPGPLLK
jgi:hypothetical protein